jgi:hypothetical protein
VDVRGGRKTEEQTRNQEAGNEGDGSVDVLEKGEQRESRSLPTPQFFLFSDEAHPIMIV